MAGVILGKDAETGTAVVIEDADRQRGLYIIGTTGTGKTTLIESLVLQDMQNGLGLCVLDPHGDLVNRLLAQVPPGREQDVVLLDPRDSEWPFGLNPYWCEDPENSELVGRTAAQIVELFEKLWGVEGSQGTSWGPRLAQFIRNTAFTLIENPGLTMAEIPALLTDAEFRERVVANVTNEQVRSFWQNYGALSRREQLDRADSTLNKLDEFLTQPIVANIVGQSRTTADFRKFMDEGKIVLVPLGLGRLGEPVVNLLGSLIVLQILNAALSREDLPQQERRQFNLYADEYQRFATPAFSTLLTEARKYGVATTIAHQIRSQLDVHNREAALNAGNLVIFAVHGEDGEELAKQFDRSPPEPPVSGQRSKRSICPEPIEHLVRNGHQNPRVSEIARSFLPPLVRSMPADRETWREDRGLYEVEIANLRVGAHLIDDLLVGVMNGTCLVSSPAFVARANTIIDALGWYFFESQPKFFARHQVWYERPNHEEFYRGLHHLVEELVLHPDADSAEKEFQRLRELRVAYWQVGRKYRAEERASDEVRQAFQAIRCLLELAIILGQEPILIETGQMEAVIERPRTYADMEGEIASRLVNQPQFHATCRITRDGIPMKVGIRTIPWLDIQDESHKFGNGEVIKRSSRGAFCKARVLVEQEIRGRGPHELSDLTQRTVPISGEEM